MQGVSQQKASERAMPCLFPSRGRRREPPGYWASGHYALHHCHPEQASGSGRSLERDVDFGVAKMAFGFRLGFRLIRGISKYLVILF